MDLEIMIPKLNHLYFEKLEKNSDNLEREYIKALLSTLGVRTDLNKYVSTNSFDEALSNVKECYRNANYSDLPQLAIDLKTYWEFLYNFCNKLILILKEQGFVVCENCGEIEKIIEDENGYFMYCCGYTKQSEIIKLKGELK